MAVAQNKRAASSFDDLKKDLAGVDQASVESSYKNLSGGDGLFEIVQTDDPNLFLFIGYMVF